MQVDGWTEAKGCACGGGGGSSSGPGLPSIVRRRGAERERGQKMGGVCNCRQMAGIEIDKSQSGGIEVWEHWDSDFPASPQFRVGFRWEMRGGRLRGTAGIETPVTIPLTGPNPTDRSQSH